MTNLDHPSLYINRELSWIEFNARVLSEALDSSLPLLERTRFLAIFATNLDEFFMIRVAGVLKQIDAGVSDLSIDGLTPVEKLEAIRAAVLRYDELHLNCWLNDIMPRLNDQGIFILTHDALSSSHKRAMRTYFRREILPVLTPLAVDPGRPFPHISNLSLNLAIVLEDEYGDARFARIKIPTTAQIPRFVSLNQVTGRYGGDACEHPYTFVYLEQLIQANLDLLFPGMTIREAYNFRVIRDADVEIADDEAADLLETIEQGMMQRQFGDVVQLTVPKNMPLHLRQMLMENLEINPRDIYELTDPLSLSDLFEIVALDLPHLKFPKFIPARSKRFPHDGNIFEIIRQGDILVHHPYESFDTTIEFIRQAALDPDVLAIKISLYRVGSNSPIVQALLEAREKGKQVAALVELKARFDEENNIVWARAMESHGVHVVYGLLGLKTHAKIALVVRREGDSLRRYVHMSTGNYNANTARVYTDIGFFSCREDLGEDLTQLFNRITGFAPNASYRKVLVAPEHLRHRLNALIDREIEHAQAGRSARIIIKANNLTAPEYIRKLYEASQAGVKIDLIIRGVCCLRPGIEGVSENIHVRSIVGRFLEHSRVFWFENNGDSEVFLSSGDIMERNLYRRVEQACPVETPELKLALYQMLQLQLADNVAARILHPDGTWELLAPADGEARIDSQQMFLNHRDNLEALPVFH